MIDFVSVKQFVRFLKKKYADRIAYRYLEEGLVKEVSYEQFVEKTEGVTAYFAEHNVTRSCIAVIGKTSYEWASTYIGVLNSNNIVVLMDPNLLIEQKEAILNQVKAEYVFLDEQQTEQEAHMMKECPSIRQIFGLQKFVNEVTVPKDSPDITIVPEELGQLMFTSGTTGQSKAVMMSYQNVASTIGVKNVNLLQDGDTVLSVLPIYHCFELTASHLGVMVVGGTICVNDAIENIMKNIQKFQPTVMFVVPAIQETLLKAYKRFGKAIFGSRLRVLASGGAKMRPGLPEEFQESGIRIVCGYGMTEMGGHTTVNMHTADKPDSVGIPSVNHLEMKIAEDGEVLLKGETMMIGYYNIDNSAYFTADGFLKTGDLGEIDKDGYLYITGRKKNVIILKNGENVYPEELEAYLTAIMQVRQAVVFEWKSRIAAMIFPKDQISIQQIAEQIRELNRKVAGYKRITKIFYRDTPFPSTPSGKIKRDEFLREYK